MIVNLILHKVLYNHRLYEISRYSSSPHYDKILWESLGYIVFVNIKRSTLFESILRNAGGLLQVSLCIAATFTRNSRHTLSIITNSI